jgi:hypothetical protein
VPAGPGDENAHDAEPPWFDPLRSDLMRLARCQPLSSA